MKDQEHDLYTAQYRELLKGVVKEALAEKDARVRQIFKEAVREWLSQELQHGERAVVKVLAALFIAMMIWLSFWPKK